MSNVEGTILGMDPQDLVRWSLVLLLIVAAFGSLFDGGALSGNYGQTPIMIFIPILLVMYLGIITIMYAMGMRPNKFELVFIPVLIISMTILAMYFTNTIPQMDDEEPSNFVTTTTSEDVIDRPSTPTTTTSRDTNPLLISAESNDPILDSLIQNVATALTIIVLLLLVGGALYWFVNRKEFDPEIQLHKVNEYTKPKFESNRNVIEYYIDASKNIEQLKGKAPEWYSPTFFSEHVDESPGPPLSSYFDQLTELYELARFAQIEMTSEQVEEARDLHHQVLMQIEQIMKQISQYEGRK